MKFGVGLVVNLGDLYFEPPRHGKTIWEIGVPDRTAAEFFVPEAHPKYINKLFVNHPERYTSRELKLYTYQVLAELFQQTVYALFLSFFIVWT